MANPELAATRPEQEPQLPQDIQEYLEGCRRVPFGDVLVDCLLDLAESGCEIEKGMHGDESLKGKAKGISDVELELTHHGTKHVSLEISRGFYPSQFSFEARAGEIKGHCPSRTDFSDERTYGIEVHLGHATIPDLQNPPEEPNPFDFLARVVNYLKIKASVSYEQEQPHFESRGTHPRVVRKRT
jgi:hypothetical protein